MKKVRKSSKKSLPFWLRIVLLINGLAAILLLTSYAVPRVSPADFWPMAFLGLVYPFLLATNVLFVVFWLFARKKWALLSVSVIFLGLGHLLNLFQISNTSRELPETGKNIHLLTYNVRNFGLYNYHPGHGLNFSYRNDIFRYLQEKNSDIICFQEFVLDRKGEFRTLDTLPGLLRARHYHFEYTRSSRFQNYFGLATFSAYPIVNKGKIPFRTNAGNLCIYTDIDVGIDTIRVYNVHFESIGLSEEDHMFVESMTNTIATDQPENITKYSRQIYNRLRRAFIYRAAQVSKIAEHIATSPHPVILAGDFNDTPMSYVYHQVARHLNDAFHSGMGMGRTYIIAVPGFRIDYIFYSDEFTPFNFKTEARPYSDHFPVSVTLHLPQE